MKPNRNFQLRILNKYKFVPIITISCIRGAMKAPSPAKPVAVSPKNAKHSIGTALALRSLKSTCEQSKGSVM
jgi:hypothetical protein